MIRSLRTRLVLMTLVAGVVGVSIAGILTRVATITAFDTFIIEEVQAEYLDELTAHYEQTGALHGFGAGRGGRPGTSSGNPGERPGREGERRNFQGQPPFLIVDETGRAVNSAGSVRNGDAIDNRRLANGESIVVNGETVGTVLFVGGAPPLTGREINYLRRTNQALVVGVIGGALVALLLGVVMSQYLLRPLRELTHAMHIMQSGNLGHQVDVHRNDELGELAATFNRMSSELERANQLREQMTADVAHDLRTPLTVITGYLEGLRDGTLPPTQKRFITMHTEALQLTQLVDDLRTLSLADAGELKLTCEDTPVCDLLNTVAQSFSQAAAEAQISMLVRCDEKLPPVSMDAVRMRRVLGNLVSNALRYTPAGGSVELAAAHHGNQVHLTVRDTGEGISPEKLPNIFERLYRAEDARTRNQGESGLGLAIARSIIEAHNGKIYAESELNRGTTMHIVLPLEMKFQQPV